MTSVDPRPYRAEQVDKAIRHFEAAGATLVESLLASCRLAADCIGRFQREAPQLRAEIGDEAAADLARREINDLICDLQDAIPTAIRGYNALLRDSQQGHGDGIPE